MHCFGVGVGVGVGVDVGCNFVERVSCFVFRIICFDYAKVGTCMYSCSSLVVGFLLVSVCAAGIELQSA